MFSFFKTRKVLTKAVEYIDKVNHTNDELLRLSNEQLKLIQALIKQNDELREEIKSLNKN